MAAYVIQVVVRSEWCAGQEKTQYKSNRDQLFVLCQA